MKSAFFWDITPCSLIDRYKRREFVFQEKSFIHRRNLGADKGGQIPPPPNICFYPRIYIYIFFVTDLKRGKKLGVRVGERGIRILRTGSK